MGRHSARKPLSRFRIFNWEWWDQVWSEIVIVSALVSVLLYVATRVVMILRH